MEKRYHKRLIVRFYAAVFICHSFPFADNVEEGLCRIMGATIGWGVFRTFGILSRRLFLDTFQALGFDKVSVVAVKRNQFFVRPLFNYL